MPADETPSLSAANERFFERGKKLWYEYTHRPEPLQRNAHHKYLDKLSEDDRLALTYAQRAMRTSGPVDLEDGDDDEEVRYRLAERIRRGTEFWDSLPEDLDSRRAILYSVDQEGDLQRDMDWASMWETNGGSDATRRATLPSILSTRSTATTPVTTPIRTGTTRASSQGSSTAQSRSGGEADTLSEAQTPTSSAMTRKSTRASTDSARSTARTPRTPASSSTRTSGVSGKSRQTVQSGHSTSSAQTNTTAPTARTTLSPRQQTTPQRGFASWLCCP